MCKVHTTLHTKKPLTKVIKLSSESSLEVFRGTEIPARPSTPNEGIVDEVGWEGRLIRHSLYPLFSSKTTTIKLILAGKN